GAGLAAWRGRRRVPAGRSSGPGLRNRHGHLRRFPGRPQEHGRYAMTGPRLALRAGLLLLTVIEAGQGFWLYLAPRSFYDDIPTVAADPPFNEHLLSD